MKIIPKDPDERLDKIEKRLRDVEIRLALTRNDCIIYLLENLEGAKLEAVIVSAESLEQAQQLAFQVTRNETWLRADVAPLGAAIGIFNRPQFIRRIT